MLFLRVPVLKWIHRSDNWEDVNDLSILCTSLSYPGCLEIGSFDSRNRFCLTVCSFTVSWQELSYWRKILDVEKLCVYTYLYINIQDKNIPKAELYRRVNQVPVMEILLVCCKKWEYISFMVEKPEKTQCLYYSMCI